MSIYVLKITYDAKLPIVRNKYKGSLVIGYERSEKICIHWAQNFKCIQISLLKNGEPTTICAWVCLIITLSNFASLEICKPMLGTPNFEVDLFTNFSCLE